MSIDRSAFQRWRPACDEYFEHFSAGIYDEEAHLQVIVPADEIEVDEQKGDMIIGRAGVDGIYFCLREQRLGVFAYYGIDDEHVLVADDIRSLMDAWTDGTLTL